MIRLSTALCRDRYRVCEVSGRFRSVGSPRASTRAPDEHSSWHMPWACHLKKLDRGWPLPAADLRHL